MRNVCLPARVALPALVLGLAAGAVAATAPAGAPPGAGCVREILVPLEDLDVLLGSGARRVLLPRAQYEELKARAEREQAQRPPLAAVVADAVYDVLVEDERASIRGALQVPVLAEGLHAVGLDVGGVGLRSARLDGDAAPLALGDDGRLILFVEGRGDHTLELEAVAPVETTAARRALNFRLPAPSAARLRIAAPGDVEVLSGAPVASRRYDEDADLTRMELLPSRSDVALVMSLNSRLRRTERVVVARSVVVNEVRESHERVHATFSFDVFHRPVGDFRIALPAGFEVTGVSSPELSRWAVTQVDGGAVLSARLRSEQTGKVVLSVSAFRPAGDLSSWQLPAFEPMDVVGHASVVGVLLEDRLDAEDVVPENLIPIDTTVLERALVGSSSRPDAQESPTRPVVAYYAPRSGRRLTARFVKVPARLDVTGNLLLTLRDEGLEVRGALSAHPREERLFDLSFTAPEGWDVLGVTSAEGAALPFERHRAQSGGRVRVRFPGGIPAGTAQKLYFRAVDIPDGWFDPWTERTIAFPVFAVEGAVRDVGAIAADARDDMRARPATLVGLGPLDQNEKARFGLSGAPTSLSYRYDGQPYEASFHVERATPRLTAETYSFFRVEPDVLVAHYELRYSVEQARVRQVVFSLPGNTPADLAVWGLDGANVKEHLLQTTDGRRRWTALLAEARRGAVHLAADFEIAIPQGGLAALDLPVVAAEGVAYQSGLVAIEGAHELDVRIENHPRKVDVGELVDAQYQPGPRLLGAYGFVGRPPPVRVRASTHAQYALPESLVRRAELTTQLSASGRSQSAARYLLRNKGQFVRLQLPAESSLWSVTLNGEAVQPRQQGDSVLVSLPPSADSASELRLVYETPVAGLCFWDRVRLLAPRLFLHGAAGDREVPVADLSWTVHVPSGYRVAGTGGSTLHTTVTGPSPAALRLVRRACASAGGIDAGQGLVARLVGFTGDVAGTVSGARRMKKEFYSLVSNLESGGAPQADAAPEPAPAPPPRTHRERIIEKLRSIMVPEIDFRQANIHDVVEFLREASKEFDPSDAERRGVNLNLNLGMADEGGQAADTADPFADALTGHTAADLPAVTFSARYITLEEALKIVTEVAQLKYRIEDDAVTIVPWHAPDGALANRVFDLPRAHADRLMQTSGDLGIRGADGMDWQALFAELGIDWPAGSSVKYIPYPEKLIVANTPQNLVLLEDLLGGLTGQGGPPGGMASPGPDAEDGAARKRVLAGMERIKIPEVDFRQANIHDVIDFLQEASVGFDTSAPDAARKGVNLILNLGPGSAGAQQQVQLEDPFSAPVQPDDRAPSGVPLITFSARQISLLEALKIVTEVAQLKFRIDGNVVMIVPHDAPDGAIIHRMYSVSPTFTERIRELTPAILKTPERDGGFLGMGAGGVVDSETSDLTEFFKSMGVAWPAGASVKHIPALGKIVVANTAEGLDTFDRIMEVIASPEGVAAQPAGAPRGGVTGQQQVLFRAPPAVVRGGALGGLRIELARAGRGILFRGLGLDPRIELTVVNRRRAGGLAWALALGVLLAGVVLTKRGPGVKTGLVVGTMLAASVVPLIPGLGGLTIVLNGSFYAACLLVLYYPAAAIAGRVTGRIRRRPAAAAANLLLAGLVSFTLLGGAARAADEDDPKPVDLPRDALILPYEGERPGTAGQTVLVPYDEYDRLRRAAALDPAQGALPAAYALAGSAFTCLLQGEEFLLIEGDLALEVYADHAVEIPFALSGGVLARAELDGKPARLRVAAPAPVTLLHVSGKGRHRLSLAVRLRLQRRGGWRIAEGSIPVAPAASLAIRVPRADTEIRIGHAQDRAAYRTSLDGEELHTAIGHDGGVRLQWRPRVSEGETDPTLTAETRGLFDVQEERRQLLCVLDLKFRGGERDAFAFALPADYVVEKVSGANVRGWQSARAGTGSEIRVDLLRPARGAEQVRFRLWRAGDAQVDAAQALQVPVVRVVGAVRQTGRLTVRRSPMLRLRTIEADGVSRTDLDADVLAGQGETVPDDSPLGTLAYETYAFSAVPFSLRIAVAAATPRVTARLRTILRIAERERNIETRAELTVHDRPLYRACIRVPAGLEVETVSAPGAFEWSVVAQDPGQLLTILFGSGLQGTIPIVFQGRLGQGEAAVAETQLPRIEVLDAERQEGDIAVQTDPSFDVRAADLAGVENVPLRRVLAWLSAAQKPLARLGLRYTSADHSGRLLLTRRQPDVSAYTVTNVRLTDRTVEETVLLHFLIRRAGIRAVRFLLPASLADAAISVPLLRQKTVGPAADGEHVEVVLELQDEVMNELRVLVENDRVMSGERRSVPIPQVLTGRTDRRYVTLENAGRDEMILDEPVGMDALSRQQKEWATVAPLLRGGLSRAFIVSADAVDPALSFQTKQRAEVATVGARIGLSEAVLLLDGNGAYRCRQTYHIENRTEQFLSVELPPGAALWTTQVGGTPVRPVVPDASRLERVHIPLVKTASGDLDYPVALRYGGGLPALRGVRRLSFPLARAVNINAEQSQVELRLPVSRQWFGFGGTMRRIVAEGDFEAGLLAYKNKQARRLLQTLKSGNLFERARAESNLKAVQDDIGNAQTALAVNLDNSLLQAQLSQSRAVLSSAEQQLGDLDKEETAPDTDTRTRMNMAFSEQRNVFSRNSVLQEDANWDASAVRGSREATNPWGFNGVWFDQGRLGKAQQEDVPPAGTAPRQVDRAGRPAPRAAGEQDRRTQARARGKSADEWQVFQQVKAPVEAKGKRRRSQKELALKYKKTLKEKAAQQVVAADVRGYAPVTPAPSRSGATDAVDAEAMHPQVTAGAAPPAMERETDAFPAFDASRWARYRFTTPRGDLSVTAYGVSRRGMDRLRHLGVVLLTAIAGLLVLRAAGRLPGRASGRTVSTGLVLAGVVSLLGGILPVAGGAVLAVGIVWKIVAAIGRAVRPA